MKILSSHNRMLTATVLGVATWTILSPCHQTLAFVVPPSKITAQRHAWPSSLYSTTETVEKIEKDNTISKQDPSPKGISTPTLAPKRGLSKPAFVEKKTATANKDLWKEIPLGVILQRTMDTAEDAWLHLCRQGYERGTVTLTPEEDAMRKTIVVLGSGWAAHALMKVADCRKLRIVVISPTNHFVFTPFLASAAAGTVEYRSMTEHVRDANPMIHDYIQGAAVGVDVKKKTVTVELNKLQSHTDDIETLEVPYDHLVVSVGSTVHDFNIAGVKEHALKLKTIEDAKKIRTAVTECFELASRPDVEGTVPKAVQERTRRATFLIAGGGPSGVELAGEISDLIKHVTRKNGAYPNLAGSTRVIVVEGGPTLVPPFKEHMRKEALASLQEQGVEVHLNTFVTEVADDYVKLSAQQFDPETGEPLKDRKEIKVPVGATIWAAGTKPQPFVGTLLEQLPEEAKNRDGRIKVDRWMRAPMHDPELVGSVFVLGDAAAHPCSDYSSSEFLPPTAQVAGQQGAYLARTLSRGNNMTATPPRLMANDKSSGVYYDPALANWMRFRGIEQAPEFHFLNLGVMAYLGGGGALSQIQLGEFPLFSAVGSTGYLLCRSVYLAKQVATRNRVLIAFDWAKSQLFGRDVTRF